MVSTSYEGHHKFNCSESKSCSFNEQMICCLLQCWKFQVRKYEVYEKGESLIQTQDKKPLISDNLNSIALKLSIFKCSLKHIYFVFLSSYILTLLNFSHLYVEVSYSRINTGVRSACPVWDSSVRFSVLHSILLRRFRTKTNVCCRKTINYYFLVWDSEIPPRGPRFTVQDSVGPRPRP